MDDEIWDEWMELTDAQQQAALDREMAAYNRWFDALPVEQQIRHCVRSALRCCATWRRVMGMVPLDFAREHLRDRQIRLLKLRIWRQTGSYPGSA